MNDDDVAGQVLARMAARHLTVAIAESLTGGLVLASLTSVPGASAVLMGGVVSYSASVKEDVLGVDRALLAEHGVVSRQVAEEMAKRVALLCGANIGLSTTGVAGPGDQNGIAAGTYWVAVSSQGHTQSQQHRVGGSRNNVRAAAVRSVLDMVLGVVGSDDQ